jgi:NAD(P)-dependent dehydrogenase (short-subunit alcohol dehydrogenase family)
MTTTLITRANKGLGCETARQLAVAGHHVWIAARDITRGQHAADALDARFVQLYVTNDASVAAAAATVGELDVLVNNAGISGGRITPSEATADHLVVNVSAPAAHVKKGLSGSQARNGACRSRLPMGLGAHPRRGPLRPARSSASCRSS